MAHVGILQETGQPAESEEARRRVLQRSTLPLLCFFGIERGLAQAPQCGGGYVCIVEAQTVAQPVEPSVTAKGVNLAAPERCPEASVDVTGLSGRRKARRVLLVGLDWKPIDTWDY